MTDERPVISPRVLALLDEAAGRRLRIRYRADPDVYRDLNTVAVIAQAWRVTHADVSGVAVDTLSAGSSEEMTTAEAAAAVGVKPETIRWHLRRGTLPGRCREGRWFVTVKDLAAYLTRRAA